MILCYHYIHNLHKKDSDAHYVTTRNCKTVPSAATVKSKASAAAATLSTAFAPRTAPFPPPSPRNILREVLYPWGAAPRREGARQALGRLGFMAPSPILHRFARLLTTSNISPRAPDSSNIHENGTWPTTWPQARSSWCTHLFSPFARAQGRAVWIATWTFFVRISNLSNTERSTSDYFPVTLIAFQWWYAWWLPKLFKAFFLSPWAHWSYSNIHGDTSVICQLFSSSVSTASIFVGVRSPTFLVLYTLWRSSFRLPAPLLVVCAIFYAFLW